MTGELYDYTNDFGGHYQIPEDPDLTGIAILDDDQSILNVHRTLGDEFPPRDQGILRRQTFASGFNRKEGFEARENFGGGFRENFEARENFIEGPAGIPCAERDFEMRKRYVRGDFYPAEYKIKSSRRDWAGIENPDWNPRPPHFVADNPNNMSHVVLKQSERGPISEYPDSSRMVYDRFTGGGRKNRFDNNVPVDSMTLRIVMFFVLVLVICMWSSYSIGYSIGKSIGHLDTEIHHPASVPAKTS